MMVFENRREAGRQLAEKLASTVEKADLRAAVVVALPRGGVPVGFEIAMALKLPLDVCVVRKVGAPQQPELAVAAVAEGGEIVINETIRDSLGLTADELETLTAPKRVEVAERVRTFRGARPAMDVEGKTVILVDDGLATGATALSAIHVMKKRKAAAVVLAVPACPRDAVNRFEPEVDALVVLTAPAAFYAVGQFYDDFTQTTDEEVREYLDQAREGQGDA